MNKAWLIDSAAREIRAVKYDELKGLQALVGGYIETAVTLPQGDVVFVDEEGLFKPQRHFFMITGNPQPIAGNGVCVGRERYDGEGEYLGTDAPAISAEALTARVRFLSREQVDAWAKANASEPAVTLTAFHEGGTREEIVFTHYGRLFGAMPRPDPYRDDSCPERACDKCGGLYRGPAVYCSLDCAQADA